MPARTSDEKAVRLSVRPSVRLSVKRVDCDKTEERSVQIFIPHERSFSLVFLRRRMVGGGRSLLPEILGEAGPIETKSPIFSRYLLVCLDICSSVTSAVTASEKS